MGLDGCISARVEDIPNPLFADLASVRVKVDGRDACELEYLCELELLISSENISACRSGSADDLPTNPLIGDALLLSGVIELF
jgi:hypothetical protein